MFFQIFSSFANAAISRFTSPLSNFTSKSASFSNFCTAVIVPSPNILWRTLFPAEKSIFGAEKELAEETFSKNSSFGLRTDCGICMLSENLSIGETPSSFRYSSGISFKNREFT